MDITPENTGRASGWSHFRVPGTNRWQWTAFGPNGVTTGAAESASEARRNALLAQDHLTAPRTTEDR